VTTPYLGQISIVGFNFAPKGWASCDGQLLSIQQNAALFSIIGTFYGGNGTTTFALPDLRGRVPVHFSNTIVLGERAGEEFVTIQNSQMPAHVHTLMGTTSTATSPAPGGNILAVATRAVTAYAPSGGTLQALAPSSLAPAGNSQPHSNLQPYLTVNFVIALVGIFPSRN
jgi:microcystin-dependent protein